MSVPKRHHYLPECYLGLYGREGNVAVFDRELNSTRIQTIRDTAVVRHLYSVLRKDGTKDPSVERALAEAEGEIPRLVTKLMSREPFSNADRSALAFSAALMMIRIPELRESIARVQGKLMKKFVQSMYPSEERAKESIAQWQKEVPDAPKADASALFEFTRRGEFDIQIHPNHTLGMVLKLLPYVADVLFHCDTFVLHTTRRHGFITSDRPFTLIADQRSGWGGSGLSSPGFKKYLTLGSELAVVFCDRGEDMSHADAPAEIVKGVNASVALMAHRFIIGRDEALVDRWGKRIKSTNAEPILSLDMF